MQLFDLQQRSVRLSIARWTGGMCIFLVVLSLRAPSMLLEGRVWGEEGIILQVGLGAGLMLLPVVVMGTDATWARGAPWVALLVLGVGPSAEVWLNVGSGQFVVALTTAGLLVTRATIRRGCAKLPVSLAIET